MHKTTHSLLAVAQIFNLLYRRVAPGKAFQLQTRIGLVACLSMAFLTGGYAAERKPAAVDPRKSAPVTFAPVAENHPLAGIWNDPEFTRRLLGSYGFASDVEPRLNAEEQVFYREKVVPLLRDDQEKAISELQSRIKPEASALFDFTLGNIYFQSEDFTNAVKFFEQATLKFPDFRRAWKNLGLVFVREGRYAEAISPLSRAITLGGGDGKTFGLLGFCCMNSERYVSAEAAYRQAILFEPDQYDFKLGLVKCQVAQGSYDSAIALLDELLQAHPEKELLWTIQANVYLQKNLPAKAAVNFEVLRRMDKATPDNLALLGDIYLSEEAKELALDAYLQAVEKAGGANLKHALRAAEILTSRGAWSEAGQLFAKVRAVAGAELGGADELKLLKLESKVAMATGAGEEAIGVLERIIDRDPLDGEALLLAGDYYARNDQVEKAEFRFESAAKLEGFEADALVKQAQLLVKSAKYAQAADVLRKAQKARPRDNVQRYLEKVEQLAGAGRS